MIKVNRALSPSNGFMFSGERKTEHLSVALQIIPSSDHLILKNPCFLTGLARKTRQSR